MFGHKLNKKGKLHKFSRAVYWAFFVLYIVCGFAYFSLCMWGVVKIGGISNVYLWGALIFLASMPLAPILAWLSCVPLLAIRVCAAKFNGKKQTKISED
ncbi:MAG: hypothetical protein LBN42_03940 [Oscillospiraceae bacterium]|nr:hypothetical protein [Oscillospiraceae bacterium]